LAFVAIAVFASFIWPVLSPLLSAILAPKQDDEDNIPNSKDVAEIDGGVWKQISIFEHVELGLRKNPDGPAVICLFQPSQDLQELAGQHAPQRQQQFNGFYNHESNETQNPRGESHSSPVFTLTYRQLHTIALRFAAGLLAHGARPDTTMVMLIPNGGEYAILLWACLLLRITYVSIDPSSLDIAGFTTLKQTLGSLKPQLVVAPDAASGKALDVAVAELGLPQPIRLCLARPLPNNSSGGWKSLSEIANLADQGPQVDETALVEASKHDRPERIHYLLFTSGTSGVPKGCPLTVAGMSHDLHSQAWLVDAESGAANLALQQAHNSRAICPLQTLQTWRAGGCVLMTGRGLRVEDVAEAVCGNPNQNYPSYRATFIVLSPPMVHEMAAELVTRRQRGGGIEPDVSSVRRIQIGGDAVTKDVLAKCVALFPRAQVCVNHGMSEGPGMFVWPFFHTPLSKIPFFGELAPIGVPAPGSLVRVWDAEIKRVVGRGQLGELHVSRGSVIRSYWAGRASDSFLDGEKGRWFNTGDVGMVSRDGVVFILGRKKDMIRRAGVAIMPAAIESSIEAFTGAQTIVVPVQHHVLGHEPFAVLSSYNKKTEQQIKAHVREALGKDYALGGLASLEQLYLAEFPVNATHKVMKSEVEDAVVKYLKIRSR
ncbi:putative amp dependent CoA ligase, partial [Podospora didyma]